MIKRSWAAAAGAVAIASFMGCYTGPNLDSKWNSVASDAPASATASAEAGSTDGLPCDVGALLSAHCTSCHSDPPGAGPMALVTFAQLKAPSLSDPSRTVAQMALDRMRDTKKPMPPSGGMSAADINAFATWVDAGAPATSCSADVAPTLSLDGGGPECVLASDCPGALICRNGVCDVECVLDKDCAPTFTCKNTRCQPPIVGGGGASSGVVDDGGGGGGTTTSDFHDFADPSSWSSTDVSGLSSGAYNGTAFDGRYMYFAPDGTNGKVMRFDTQGAFGAASSWSTFDATALDTRAMTFRGSVFDGRYLYLIPSGAGGVVTRYDTQAPFGSSSSWTTFEAPTVNALAKGFTGATFDGRYVYLVPGFGTMTVRFDTHAEFTNVASWTAFNLKTAAPAASSFAGAIYDGHYVYYVPWRGPTAGSGALVRFDPAGAFADPTSWSALDLTSLNPAASGYHTAAFDGRYLYLVPGWTSPAPVWSTSLLARFDTQGAFTASASWTFYDMAAIAPEAAGFNTATFDGRYLILSPGYSGNVSRGTAFRFDTTGRLDHAAAWSEFDVSALRSSMVNIKSTAFDGRYVYFSPVGGAVARFDAKATPAMPALPAFYGSSF